MDLNEKAEEGGAVYSIEDAAELTGWLRVDSTELAPADEVGTEQFPKYGDWMPVTRYVDGMKHEETHVEVPQGLAQELLDAEVEEGTKFRIASVAKDRGGMWDPEVEYDD